MNRTERFTRVAKPYDAAPLSISSDRGVLEGGLVRSVMANERAGGVTRLVKGLDQRRGLRGGAAQEGLDRQLLQDLARLRRQTVGGFVTAVGAGVSRAVALPLCLTLSSQPHLAGLLLDPVGSGASRRDRPLSFSQTIRSSVIGLQEWEMTELAADIDRRASQQLRQVRGVRWLWHHHGTTDDQELLRRLLTGIPHSADLHAKVRGGRIYALVTGARSSPIYSLYMPWMADPEDDGSFPLSVAAGRYVSSSLREGLGRSLGASPAETVRLLDYAMCLVPATDHQDHLDRDLWRSSGAALMTGLAHNSQIGHRLSTPVGPSAIRWDMWLSIEGGRLKLGDVEAAFERMALKRVALAIRLVHAGFIARRWAGIRRPLDGDDLAAMDVRHHVMSVLRPLVEWCTSVTTVESVARRLNTPTASAAAALTRVGQRWQARLERWTQLPSANDPWPPISRLLDHLVRFISVLESLLNRKSLSCPHHDAFLLYAAHAIAESPDIGLMPVDPDLPGIPETMATELWGAWKQLNNSYDSADTVVL